MDNTVDINLIWVERKDRQRKAVTEEAIQQLASSIETVGLIHPPVITRDYELKVGETRWLACQLLGWAEMPVTYTDQVDELTLHLIELEENIRRTDLPWQDEVDALKKYHELLAKKNPKQTAAETASALNMSANDLGRKLAVAEQIEKGNTNVTQAKVLSKAVTITERQKAREKAAQMAAIASVDNVKKPTAPILNTSFIEWQKTYSGNKFTFIHCDFPYGISADKHNQGGSKSMGGYDDRPEVYFELLDALDLSMENVVADTAHLMFWFSMDYYNFTFERLHAMGWNVNPFPLVWHKSDNTGILPDAKRGPRRTYETAFLAYRGEAFVSEVVANSFSAPAKAEDHIHMSQKPRVMLHHYFRMFVDEHTSMLDPTCGSGNSVVVAKDRGAKNVLGIEINEDFSNRAKENFNG